MSNPNFNSLTATTIKHYVPVLEEQIFTSKVLLWVLRNAGAFKTANGTQYVQPLLATPSQNTGSYSDYDVFSIVPDDGFTAAEYPYRQYAGNLIISGEEQAKNSGKEAIINLVQSKLQQLEWSMAEEINTMFYGDGTGNAGKDFYGLEAIVDDDNVFGGINRGTYDYWKAFVEDASGDPLSLPLMRHVYNSVSDGNDQPTNLIGSQIQYEMYEHLIQDSQRITDNALGDAGFINLMFKGAPFAFDRAAEDDDLYFLNTKYLHVPTLDGTWFDVTDWIPIANQDAQVKRIRCFGNFVTSASRRQGVIRGLDDSDPWEEGS